MLAQWFAGMCHRESDFQSFGVYTGSNITDKVEKGAVALEHFYDRLGALINSGAMAKQVMYLLDKIT